MYLRIITSERPGWQQGAFGGRQGVEYVLGPQRLVVKTNRPENWGPWLDHCEPCWDGTLLMAGPMQPLGQWDTFLESMS